MIKATGGGADGTPFLLLGLSAERDAYLASAVDRMKSRLRAERVEIEARLFELA